MWSRLLHYVVTRIVASQPGNRGTYLQDRENRKAGKELRLLGASTPLRAAVVPPLSAARWLLLLIVAAGVYFFHGFLFPVLAALVIAFASWPLYRRLLRAVDFNRTIAASLATFAIVAFLVVPIGFAGAYAVAEIQLWIGWAVEANRVGAPVPEWIAGLPLVGDRSTYQQTLERVADQWAAAAAGSWGRSIREWRRTSGRAVPFS